MVFDREMNCLLQSGSFSSYQAIRGCPGADSRREIDCPLTSIPLRARELPALERRAGQVGHRGRGNLWKPGGHRSGEEGGVVHVAVDYSHDIETEETDRELQRLRVKMG